MRARLKAVKPAGLRDPDTMGSMLAQMGGYVGARRDRAATQNWSLPASSADAAIIPDLDELWKRSSDLVRNAPLAAGAINTNCTAVVGSGLWVRPQVDRDLLKMSDDQADDWERAAERVYLGWAQSTDCDVSRTQTFPDLQDLVLRSVLEGGDCFVPKRRAVTGRPGGLDLQLQVIEAARCSDPRGRKAPEGRRIVGGVEIDGWGAPVQYWISNRHPGELRSGVKPLEWTGLPVFDDAGRRLVLHVFARKRPEQTRGVPYLAPVIEPFKSLARYSDAELQAAVVGAMLAVFVKTAQHGGSPFAQAGKAAPAAGQLELDNATIAHLMPGEEVVVPAVGRPNQAFDPFVMAWLRQIGVALELPFEVLIKHFTASYSAARAALLEAWRGFLTKRAWLVRTFCQPIYEEVLTEAVARGLLAAPGFLASPMIRRAYCGSEWVGPTMGQINPKDEVEAYEKARAFSWITDERVTAELYGGDWERNHAQRKKEEAWRKRDGLAAPAPQPGQAQPAAKPDPDKKEAAA